MGDLISEPALAALIGLGGGCVLGLAARLGRFCTLGAVEGHLYGGRSDRLRMWVLAIGVAVLASFAAMEAGLFDPTASFYLNQTSSMSGAVIGGLVFGYGMALAGNCGYGALARLGGGDLRSFVIVVVMGLAAYVTLSGPLASVRLWLFPRYPAASPQGFAHRIGELTGAPVALIGVAIGAVIVVAALWRAKAAGLTAMQVFWGSAVGLAVASAWIGTYLLAVQGFEALPVVSHTFSTPIGDTLLYAMTSSGARLSFGVGSVAGVLSGSLAGSLWLGRFRWEACEDPRELRRQIFGAALMGWGAVTAAGCSIGQGISAFSLLAYSAPVTLVSIWIGAALGLRQMIAGWSLAR